MKQESGFKKSGHAISESHNLQSVVEQSMSPFSVADATTAFANKSDIASSKVSMGGKRKVIPLRLEDIDACDGGAGRTRTSICLVVVLSFVLGFIIMRSLGLFADAEPLTVGDLVGAKKEPGVAQTLIAWDVPDDIGEGGRDITKSGKVAAKLLNVPQMPDFSVSVIIVYSDSNKSAIIGDLTVRVGDVIDGVKICMITDDSVEFEKDGVRWIVNIE